MAEPHIAFINPGYGDRGFWKDVRDTMQAAADQFGFQLTVFDSDRDWAMMAESANRVFAMNPPPDYIIAVNEHQQGTRIVLEAQERGIPVLMLLNDLTEEQKKRYGRPGAELTTWIATLVPDNERAGFEIAQSLITAARDADRGRIPENICLLSLTGDSVTPASLLRIDGLDTALERYPVLREQRRLVANWSFEEAYRRTADWLETDGCLDAVWAANDNIALGAIKAIEEAGKIPGQEVFVGGLNWSAEGLESVAAGKMTMTHGGHFLAGAWIMVLLKDYLEGVERLRDNPEVFFRMQAVTPENLQVYQRVLGERDWDKIDFSQFSLVNNPEQRDYQFGIKGLSPVSKRD
ncbi:ABC transporter substrate-binding protein [Thalassospira sp.]|uniref:ABC transporter substrate-binding protein n=1 Tax=Thalassospira sp. TaxID=1912094 RepID=UPI0025F91830|nr:ABC transporter substrate-binding protein [Thalassospira sp.]